MQRGDIIQRQENAEHNAEQKTRKKKKYIRGGLTRGGMHCLIQNTSLETQEEQLGYRQLGYSREQSIIWSKGTSETQVRNLSNYGCVASVGVPASEGLRRRRTDCEQSKRSGKARCPARRGGCFRTASRRKGSDHASRSVG